MRFVFLFLLAVFIFAASPSRAEGDLASFGIGYYDINDNEGAWDFRMEYRWDIPALKIVRPWVGAEATSDGAFYGVGGVLADIRLGDNVFLSPGFGAGLYVDGNGKDLKNDLEFRSQLELGYEFSDSSRVSVAASHISNAGIGPANPGTEILSLYYHVPADIFTAR